MEFGQNGVRLDLLDEEAAVRETRDNTLETAVSSCAALLATAALLLYAVTGRPQLIETSLAQLCFLVLGLFCIVPGLVHFSIKAVEDDRLPVKIGKKPKHEHISGIFATGFLIAVFAITLVARAFDSNYGNLVIDDAIGTLVIACIALAFLLFIFAPRISNSKLYFLIVKRRGAISILLVPFDVISRRLGRGFSIVDSWLVHVVAPFSGATQSSAARRYSSLIANLAPCGVLAWYMPAPSGLLPIAWAFILVISVARRWAWTEVDREVALRNPNYDAQHLKVGVKEDLRDEALLALLFLIVLLPLGIRQFHFGLSESGVFAFGVMAKDDLWTWVSFFGVELAKAVPFVDWADIYGVRSEASIQATTAMASHVIFVARAIVDLVFLAALLQAISISIRWSKHKQMFFNREIDRLDAMVERREFQQLAKRAQDNWVYDERLARFEHYNAVSLSRIRLSPISTPEMNAVASEIMKRRNIPAGTPGEQFLELALQARPDVAAVHNAFDKALEASDLDIDTLMSTHNELNGLPAFNGLREQLIRALNSLDTSDEVTTAQRYLLKGQNADSIAANRLLVIPPLVRRAREDDRALSALRKTAKDDRAKIVREAAMSALSELSQWSELEARAQEILKDTDHDKELEFT